MGPRHKRFWLPLTRLGAGFVAVVVVGNVVLHAFRPDAAGLATPDQIDVSYFAKKKKRLERQFFKVFEKLLPPAMAPAKEKISTAPIDQPRKRKREYLASSIRSRFWASSTRSLRCLPLPTCFSCRVRANHSD